MSKYSTEKAPPPVGPYPHARQVGDFVFVSGMGPRRPGTSEIPGVFTDAEGNVVSHDIVEQAESVIENVSIVLKEAGASLEDVVDVTVFLTHMRDDFKKFN